MEEAIVLAGGLGTRLRSVVKDVPKPMAPVNNRPFLDYILHFLSKNSIKRVVLAVGYKHEIIRQYLNNGKNSFDLQIEYSIETELLGTGGAIWQALRQIKGDDAFVINGDTFFDVPLNDLKVFARSKSAEIAIALKELPFSDRYGQISFAEDGRILSFSEKDLVSKERIVINGGIYYLQKKLLEKYPVPGNFSLEKDFFVPYITTLQAYGKIYQKPFIDIGIPEDYELAQSLTALAEQLSTTCLDSDRNTV
jgi:D-glycero-alpha-D-manno-heptose 1-phosphate guanylyltransferase